MKWFWIKLMLVMSPCAVFLVELAMVKWLVKPGRRFLNWFAAVGLLGACKFAGFAFFGGNDFNPELPLWLIAGWGWLESAIWVGLPVGAAVSLLAWAVRPFRRAAFGTWLALSLSVAAWGMWEGMCVPSVVEREAVVEGLPAEFDGYRLAHLSDLHCSSAARRGKIAAIVERTNAARPDLVAITGDFVDGHPSRRADDLAPLAGLRAPDGVVACTGNHEKYFRIAEWMPYYRRWGVRMLRDEWVAIRRGGASLVVAGEEDRMFGGGPREGLYDGSPVGGCRILLRHQPLFTGWSESVQDVRLQLSGHTHGGAMPVIDRFVARNNNGHVRGFYREGRLLLYVSPGTGQWAGFPLRFFDPQEITILILRRPAAATRDI